MHPTPDTADDAVLIARLGTGSGAVEVYEDAHSRWMQYGSGTIQSLMDLTYPHRLTLPYTRAMMAALLFNPEPSHVALVGLGGGSFVRFFRHHCPRAAISAIEHDERVIALAYAHFGLDRESVSIYTADARIALAQAGPQVDLALIDLFDSEGLPGWMYQRELYELAAGRLTEVGILVANLWMETDDEFFGVMHGIREVFASRTLVLTVIGYRNLAVLAFKREPAELCLRALYERARALRTRFAIDFPALLGLLRETNLVHRGALVL